MSIKEVLKKYNKIEIELLLAHVLKKPKEFLFLNPEKKLSSYQVKKLSSLVKRCLKGEPIAYILGYKDFYGLEFKVNREVLIPRPETEELVNLVLAKLRSLLPSSGEMSRVQPSDREVVFLSKTQPLPSPLLKRRGKLRSSPIKILDLGTGSGCIIVSLAKEIQNLKSLTNVSVFKFYGSDISKKALQVAKQNAKTHRAKVTFIHSDILQNVRMSFDVIVANLPYVPKRSYEVGIRNLEWEPKGALVDPVKDFDIYHRFLKQAAAPLNPRSMIFLEIDPKAKPLITKWAKKYLPKAEVKFSKDYNNLWRYVEIKLS